MQLAFLRSKSTGDLPNKMKSLNKENKSLVSIDIKSLYTKVHVKNV